MSAEHKSAAAAANETILPVDIIIIGGGIAGLWLLNDLRLRGYSALLFEQDRLGAAQTIASQGMIHGGIKYALGGALTSSSEAIAAMPARWRQCLKQPRPGQDVDLRNTQILSEHFCLWSSHNLASRLSSFIASKATRGRVSKLAPADYPAVLANPAFKGSVYRLLDLVIDTPSLLRNLRSAVMDCIYRIDWQSADFAQGSSGEVLELLLQAKGRTLRLQPAQLLLCAGEGNGALMKDLGISEPSMQLRPLQQVMVKHQHRGDFYAHCMGSNPSPRLTVSSHCCRDGKMVWYLGGDLATENVDSPAELLIDKARGELRDLFPWLDFSNAEWRTLRLNRAEPKQKSLLKPDQAFVARAGGSANTLVAWPTKLSLAPDMSDRCLALLKTMNCVPRHPQPDTARLRTLAPVSIAEPPWESAF